VTSKAQFRVNTPTVTHDTIDGESVVINLETGNYYSLQGTGAEIWALIVKNATMEQMIETLSGRYHGPRAKIVNGLSQLLDELQREQLIVLSGSWVPTEWMNSAEVPTATSEDKPDFQFPELQKFTDMQELLLVDPIHEVDAAGWPRANPKL